MAKLLVVNDNTKLPLNFNGDILATFEDDHKWGTKEEEHIKDGLFAVIDIPGVKASDFVQQMQDSHPKVKRMWQDDDGTWYELNDDPKSWYNYDNGVIHNVKRMTNNQTVANEAIKIELEATKAELSAVKASALSEGMEKIG